MSPTTPKKTKEEILKALKDLQIDPEDLDQVVAATPKCQTCYSKYGAQLAEEEPTE